MSETIQDKEKKPLKVKVKKPTLKTKEHKLHKVDLTKKEEIKKEERVREEGKKEGRKEKKKRRRK